MVGRSTLRFRTEPLAGEGAGSIAEVSQCQSCQDEHPSSDVSRGKGEEVSGDLPLVLLLPGITSEPNSPI